MNEIRKPAMNSPAWKEKNVQHSGLTYLNPCTPPPVANWQRMGPYSGPTHLYKEPVQGCCGNCYLIAALASVAWAAQTRISHYPSFQFMDPITNTNSVVNLTSENLPVDANNQLIFARSETNYTWPMLYEKAYACWKGCRSLDGNPDHPDISLLPGGAGINGLISVSRYAHHQTFLTGQQTPNQIIANILRLPSGKTTYPSVACTQNPDHTYSLLGVYQGTHIVLRNPTVRDPEPPAALAAGVWNAGPGALINFADANDGIFAISANDFKTNFYSYGYVRP
ncbi:MAG TPA: C2 family cysteine protease [Methanoregulaceae archaeon]|nr:C2 family cysteine protease [Methanoregulaceae archaeon]